MIGAATQQTSRAYLNCQCRSAAVVMMPTGGIDGLCYDYARRLSPCKPCQPTCLSALTIAEKILDPFPPKAPPSNPHSAIACYLFVSLPAVSSLGGYQTPAR